MTMVCFDALPARFLALLAAVATLALGGCAVLTVSPPVVPTAPPAPAAAPATQVIVVPGAPVAASAQRPPGAGPVAVPFAVPFTPSPLRPFADVVRDAKRIDGLFTLWQKDDKVWIELQPGDLNQPFFLSPKIKTGIGEGMFLGGMMSDAEGIVEFRTVHGQLQMIWRNTEYVAAPSSAEGRAVAAAFSPSLVASAMIAGQPHPQRKSLLVEANALFVADLTAIGTQLQRRWRQGYVFDPRNSAITAVRGTPDSVVFEVLSHFATGALALPVPGGIGPSPGVPRALPDPRSMFMTLHYSLARLPAAPMAPRRADARIGHFTTAVADFSDDAARTPRRHYVNRWRLEKKDPDAALSEPVKPIVFWLDRTVPERWRPAITQGVLEWNKAFERIGFKNAIVVEMQPDDADFDTLDFGRASIRWITSASASFGAIGPHHHDPRTGEILDADIAIESLASRAIRSVRSQILGNAMQPGEGAEAAARIGSGLGLARNCTFAADAAEQMGYAFDVLEARGELDPAAPEAQQFVEQYLREVAMHEVGHALGLRHNFRASRAYTEAQLADAAFTAANGIAASVMEYAPINLASPGQPAAARGTPFNTALGPYDYWAIEYAYRPFASAMPPAEQTAALARIAGRSAEPLLAYGTDEDNALGIDPESLLFDLGDDVLAFARKRIAIAQDLLARQETRVLRPDADYAVLRRAVVYAIRDVSRVAGALTRQVGGVRTVRDAPSSGRDPLSPLAADRQRQALALITDSVLAADSLHLSPALQRKLAPDYLERDDGSPFGDARMSTDFSLSAVVLDMQRGVLAALMNDATAVRLLDSAEKSPSGAGRSLRVAELYAQLTHAVWSELDRPGSAIAARRRELQREHVNRLAGLMLRPQALSRADARASLRVEARALAQRLDRAARRAGTDADTRAHLQDSAETLSRALAARLERAGV